MVNVHGMARLGVLAVGLGIGAAWAQTPVASADSSSDWLSSVDSLLSGASPAAATPIDLEISFDGYTIYNGGGTAEADTNTGDYSLAIAYGDNATAIAGSTGGVAVADGADAYAGAGTLGTGDVAVADGSGALAWAAGGNGDVSEAVGTNADAYSGAAGMGVTGADYDTAIDVGNNTIPATYGADVGAYAGNSDLGGGTDGGTGVHDTAIDIGNNTGNATFGSDDGAFAGAGNLGAGLSGDGNNDTALVVGNNSAPADGAWSGGGNGNFASESGATEGGAYVFAGQGNDNTAIGATENLAVDAGGGNDDYAYVDGPANSTASAEYGNSDVAYVIDPFGAAGSIDHATAGNGFSNDLAEVLFAHGSTTADSANLLYDIVSLFGNISGSF
jgi:hypothetical protein